MHVRGQGVEQSEERAIEWWRRAAKQGHDQAQFNVGFRYWRGSGGLEQSDALAMDWWRKAAAQGHADARVYLQAAEEEAAEQSRDGTEAPS